MLEKDRVVRIISIRDIVRSWAKAQASRAITIQIREAVTPDLVTVGRDATLRQAARLMVELGQGAALVEPSRPKSAPGIITDRDLADGRSRSGLR